jgi:hypothetical protein
MKIITLSPPQIAYVIAAWFGGRRVMDTAYQNDRLYYLREQFRRLLTLKHKYIKKVIIGYPKVPETKLVEDSLKDLVSEVKSKSWFDIELFPRNKNTGMAFGTWTDVMLYNSFGEYSGFLLLEDDYAFAIDNFDDIMIGIADANKAGFVCGHGYKKYHGLRIVCTFGYISSSRVARVCSKYMHHNMNMIRPNLKVNDGGVYVDRLVTTWSHAFVRNKIKVVDVNEKYVVKYRRTEGSFEMFGDPKLPILLESIV